MTAGTRSDDLLVDCQAAFAAATQAILPALRGYARRLTKSDAGSDDLVQETLVRAWAARKQFMPGSNFKAWLFRIARNTFLSGIRQSWRSTPLSPEAHAALLVSTGDQEDALYYEDFGKALATLPQVQRDALLLIVEAGMTYDEAALAQHVEPGTLKSRVARARSALMRYFDPQPHEREARSPRKALALQEPPLARSPSRYELWKASGARTIG